MHKPVLLKQVLQVFKESPNQNPKRFLDGTFGRGGHTKAILETFDGIIGVAVDQDRDAIEFAKANFSEEINKQRLKIIASNFNELDFNSLGNFDFILLDLGVSSPQLDQGERGFSFYQDGPLDMRMNQDQEITAAIIVNEATESELIDIFKTYGEVFNPFRVVRAIVHDRKEKPFTSTLQLASLIERVDGWRIKGQHPATRYFMGLRIKVNEELQVVEEAIPKFINLLSDQGRFAVITFHSLEDRIVKNIFKSQLDKGILVNKKVIIADDDEIKENPRSRSAKLRVFQRSIS